MSDTRQAAPDIEVPVVVVGGSMVGLATAMFLAHHGIDVLSVEKHYGTAIHPRAGYFQLRTMELMRVAGISDEMFVACAENKDFESGLLKNIQAAAERYDVQSTPTFVFNDGAKKFSGAGTYEGFVVDLEDMLRATAPVGQTEIPADKLAPKQ